MITTLEIENLRGIRSGRLEGLKPLTILTGPNASGKSTVLDALLIGATEVPLAAAVGEAVSRHPAVLNGAKWLIGDPAHPAKVRIEIEDGRASERLLRWKEGCSEALRDQLVKQGAHTPFSTITVSPARRADRTRWDSATAFGTDNQYAWHEPAVPASPTPYIQLVDPGLPEPLHRSFTAVARTGRRDDVYDLLSELIPDFERLEILTEDDDRPSLYVTSAGRSIPVGLAGDGVQAFIQLALEVAIAPGGLVLVEEPEVYQHPRAIWQTARLLLANMRRGVQVVLTTHSLELIDAFLAEAAEDDLEQMALFNLLLEGGELKSARRDGQDIAFARQTLENDLR